MKKFITLLLCFTALGVVRADAQGFAIKTNLLYDATTTLNAGIEFSLNRQLTLDLSGSYNPWSFNGNKKLKHWLIQPEFRYWASERFCKHFFGVHLLGGKFHAGGVNLPFGGGEMKNNRYLGYLYGAGVAYGYHWMLDEQWGLEATIGGGYARVNYKEYGLSKCSPRLSENSKNYWGITKIGITLIFIIK